MASATRLVGQGFLALKVLSRIEGRFFRSSVTDQRFAVDQKIVSFNRKLLITD